MKGQVILVTGASGAVGSVVVRRLLEQGTSVAGGVRSASQGLPVRPKLPCGHEPGFPQERNLGYRCSSEAIFQN